MKQYSKKFSTINSRICTNVAQVMKFQIRNIQEMDNGGILCSRCQIILSQESAHELVLLQSDFFNSLLNHKT